MEKTIKLVTDEIEPGQKVYLVGGYIRDLLLNRECRDLDFVVTKDVLKLVHKVSKKIARKVIVLDDLNRIYRIVLDPCTTGAQDKAINLDFSAVFGKDIYSDLSRRDFTVNAIAVEISKQNINLTKDYILANAIDLYKGISDLKKKIIEIISPKNFMDDPLRMLRAFRLSCELGFAISPKTSKYIRKYSGLIRKPARERIREEIMKTLSCPESSDAVYLMDKEKLLEHIFPEIKEMKKSSRNYYFHPDGLWQHSRQSLAKIEHVLGKPGDFFKDRVLIEKILNHIKDRMALIKFITLFHDLAKPRTVRRIEGRVRFFGHEQRGAQAMNRMMKKMKFSNKEISVAERLVKNHMRPGNLSSVEIPTEKAMFRFFRDLGENSVDLLLLSLSDRMSYIGITTTLKKLQPYITFTNKAIARYFDYVERLNRPKLINGNIIMNKFRLKSGPWIGALLRAVEEKQLTGKIHTAEQAIEIVKNYLPRVIKKYKLDK